MSSQFSPQTDNSPYRSNQVQHHQGDPDEYFVAGRCNPGFADTHAKWAPGRYLNLNVYQERDGGGGKGRITSMKPLFSLYRAQNWISSKTSLQEWFPRPTSFVQLCYLICSAFSPHLFSFLNLLPNLFSYVAAVDGGYRVTFTDEKAMRCVGMMRT